jgi:hypothetical protein
LPDKVNANYTLAIPVVDTTLSIKEFVTLEYPYLKLDSFKIPEGDSIQMGEQRHHVDIDDYTPSRGIEWIEPQMIIDPENFPEGTKVGIKIYTKRAYGEKEYFWLNENYSFEFKPESSFTVVPDRENPPIRIDEDKIKQLRQTQYVYLNIIIKYPSAISGAQIANHRVNVKFGLKLSINTDLKLNL